MKKTFSITISGVVFHIEEDGYERLRSYLASVQQYFSAYEGSGEIIADIEGRIAEKFAEKLQKEAKQSLSSTDVDDLIRSMGTVADFEAIEEEEDLQTLHARQQANAAGQGATSTTTGTPTATLPPVAAAPSRRLYRDTSRKLVGGVAAGIAHHFNTDPLWVRLIFLVLALAVPGWFDGPFNNDSMDFFGPVSGFTILIYIALWVSLPANAALEEDEKIKKLYRDPDQKVVGGVVAGVAKYTGWDLGLLRFLFVISIFVFGTGILLYVILWAITPEAKTLTDKMQMTGEPITLENIETNVKRGLNVENQPESGLTKFLLLPFRALAAVFAALGPLFNFLLVALRVFAALLLVVIGASVIIGLFVALLALLGASGLDNVVMDDTPLRLLNDASPWLWVFGFLAVGIPFLALAIAGSSLLVRRNLFNARLGLPLLALWIFGTVGAVAMGAGYAANYQRGGEVEKVVLFPAATVAQLDAEDNDDESWSRTQLTLEAYEGTDLQLVQTFRGRGRTREDAKANAASLVYNVIRKDSTLIFNERAELAPGRPYRGQELKMVLRVPYGKTFRMSRNFASFVTNRFNNDLFESEKGDQFRTTLFQFSKEKDDLICLNCQVPVLDNGENNNSDFNDEDDSDDGIEMGRGEFSREEKVSDFQKLEINGNFYVEVKQGAAYRVELDGSRRNVWAVRVRTDGNTLNIGYGDGFQMFNRRKRVNVRITMPTLSGVEFTGATRAEVKGFNQNTDFDVQLTGASTAVFTSLNAQTIDAELSGAAKLTLVGDARTLKADISGASELKAASLKTSEADVDASGASNAQVYVEQKLQATATGASHVGYKGSVTNVNKSTSGGSSVDRDEGQE